MKKYRIFYDSHYRRDVLDFSKDIEAQSDEEALRITKRFIEKENKERAETTRKEMLPRCPEAVHFTIETLLHSNCFVLTGISRVNTTSTTVRVKKEVLRPINIA